MSSLRQHFPVLTGLLSLYDRSQRPTDSREDQAFYNFVCKVAHTHNYQRLIDEIDSLLAMGLDNDRLKQILVSDFGCHFDPTARFASYSDWLGYLADSLRGVC